MGQTLSGRFREVVRLGGLLQMSICDPNKAISGGGQLEVSLYNLTHTRLLNIKVQV